MREGESKGGQGKIAQGLWSAVIFLDWSGVERTAGLYRQVLVLFRNEPDYK